MTKYRKLIEEYIEKYWTPSRTLCDFCHKDIKKVNKGNNTEIILDAKIGNHWGTDGDARTGYVLDICEECFEDKLKPAIEKEFSVSWRQYDVEDSNYRNSFSDYYENES